jgi:hypothetical protein
MAKPSFAVREVYSDHILNYLHGIGLAVTLRLIGKGAPHEDSPRSLSLSALARSTSPGIRGCWIQLCGLPEEILLADANASQDNARHVDLFHGAE